MIEVIPDETLVNLTRKKKPFAQARVLDSMKIPFRRRPDGTILVFEHDIHAPTQTRPAPPRLRLPTAR
jgi:hypothetical protein